MSNHTTAGTKKRSSYHQPHRKPARETLERILSAAEDQLREQELDAFTIQAVLQRTGLSVGAFYSRFPDKTALIHELQERVHLRVEARISNNLSLETEVVQSLEEAVDSGFGVLIRHMLDERRLFSAFIMLSVFDPVMRASWDPAWMVRIAVYVVGLTLAAAAYPAVKAGRTTPVEGMRHH